jgi:transposase
MKMETTTEIGVGIDTARYGHHVTFLGPERQPAAVPLTVIESSEGYHEFQQQLHKLAAKHQNAHFHVHIDAAGQYATNLERFLRKLDLPMTLSVGEPRRNQDYHKAISPKRKSDATESFAMARFGIVEQPGETPDIPEEIYVLREVVSRLQGQVKDSTRTINRLHNVLARVFPELATIVANMSAAWVLELLKKYPTPQRIAHARITSLLKIPFIRGEQARKVHAAAAKSIGSLRGELAEALVRQYVEQVRRSLAEEKKLQKLLLQAFEAMPSSGHVQLESIPGIGRVTAAVLTSKIVAIERFETAEKLVGYFGIFPEERSSGVDRLGNPLPAGKMRMSRKGDDLVRRYLWNAAQCAIRFNPAVRALYARQRARGKRGDVALGHCMRKLLHLAFAVWASDQPFDKDHYPWGYDAKEEEASSPLPQQPEEAAGHERDVLPNGKVAGTDAQRWSATNIKVEPTVVLVKQGIDPGANSNHLVDYAYLREQITMQQVLSHLGHWNRLRGRGSERRGPCPLHGAEREHSRSFAVNVSKNVYRCFHPECSQAGNVLDFWAAVHNLSLYKAALDLAETFQLETTRNREEGARNTKPKPR